MRAPPPSASQVSSATVGKVECASVSICEPSPELTMAGRLIHCHVVPMSPWRSVGWGNGAGSHTLLWPVSPTASGSGLVLRNGIQASGAGGRVAYPETAATLPEEERAGASVGGDDWRGRTADWEAAATATARTDSGPPARRAWKRATRKQPPESCGSRSAERTLKKERRRNNS